jgi:hypothetical protein
MQIIMSRKGKTLQEVLGWWRTARRSRAGSWNLTPEKPTRDYKKKKYFSKICQENSSLIAIWQE